MTREEFAKIAVGLRTSYPDQNILNTSEAMDWWFSMLKDIDYQITAQAVTKWISTERFAPKIADIRSAASEVALGEIPDWGIGWQEVKYAMSAYGYTRPEEALASMSEITREVVKRMGWLFLCGSSIDQEETNRANFRMLYEEIARRKKLDAQTPGYLKELIAKTQESMKPMLSGDDMLGGRMLNGD